MILRHKNKHPPSVYKKGNSALVKLMKNETKIKEKGKTLMISKGKTLKTSSNRYD